MGSGGDWGCSTPTGNLQANGPYGGHGHTMLGEVLSSFADKYWIKLPISFEHSHESS